MERLECQQAQLELDALRDAKPVKAIPQHVSVSRLSVHGTLIVYSNYTGLIPWSVSSSDRLLSAVAGKSGQIYASMISGAVGIPYRWSSENVITLDR